MKKEYSIKKAMNLLSTLTIIVAQNPQGFTFNVNNFTLQPEGYAVALAATQNSFGAEGLLKVVEFVIDNNIDCIGGWLDSESGLYYFDATSIHNDLSEALKAGKDNNQLAIYDLSHGTEIRINN